LISPVFIEPIFEGINRIRLNHIIRQTVPKINDPVTKRIFSYIISTHFLLQFEFIASGTTNRVKELGKFFFTVFTVEQERSSSSLPVKPCDCPIRELVFNEQIILEKLNKLNISKSPGPDGIHPEYYLNYDMSYLNH